MKQLILAAETSQTSQSTLEKLAPMGLIIAVCAVVLVLGVFIYRGTWRSPVSKVYPGGPVLLVYIPVGFIVAVIGASVSIIWPPRDYGWSAVVWLGLMVLGGVIAVVGFIVGATAHPRALLPKWVRAELINKPAGPKDRNIT